MLYWQHIPATEREEIIMFQFRKLTAVLCAFCLLLTGLSCVTVSAERAPAGYTGKFQSIGLTEEGYFSITRELAKNEPMGEENTWTIFVYLCGSDLETDLGLASGDLQEMIDGSKGSCVRYVVMTGGSLEWQNTVVDSSVLQIHLIEDGCIEQVNATDEYHYMNDPNVLRSFLSWGVENYPADKMGVVVWDHGGGSIGGVCIDQWFREALDEGTLGSSADLSTTLTLPQVADAVSQVYDEMTDQFEFIGFDACLMGTLENAFILSPYARYMYASEESEPGYGWDYVAIGQAIGATGEIGGADLGVVVCDSFYESCQEVNQAGNATLSCIDLSKMNDLAIAFDSFAIGMLNASDDPHNLSAIQKSVNRVDFFGGNSKAEGYFNLIDLADLVNVLSPITGRAEDVLEALDQAVVYTISGPYHSNACGLSVYYPLHVDVGSGELGQYAEVACSPYYYGYVAQNAYSVANGGRDGYDFDYSLSAWVSAMDPDAETIVETYDEPESTGESPYVEFYEEPVLLDDGTYGFSLTDESLTYISSVEADIFFVSEDGEDFVFLGSTDDIIADWENGVFLDNFDGLWFCLPDGQLISSTVVTEEEDFTIYTTPVLVNGVESNLRFIVDYQDYSVTLDSVWSGADEFGLSGRNTYLLREGDVIQPIFSAFNLDTLEDLCYYGDEYVYDGSNDWSYTSLFDSEYYYQFSIYDIYGDYCTTDGVYFTVEDGQIFFKSAE